MGIGVGGHLFLFQVLIFFSEKINIANLELQYTDTPSNFSVILL